MIPRDKFETYEDMILTDQIPAGRVTTLLEENPEFNQWYCARRDARRNQKVSHGW